MEEGRVVIEKKKMKNKCLNICCLILYVIYIGFKISDAITEDDKAVKEKLKR